ncbi:hypothetical protein E3N88_13537 [Mikania micrantha]|uniref:Uncharacterized protein n=1 Tax=Mikania micrantha TaxID=192012 RepID=A0A5N6P9X8_9ASTR|nr:hypothetical protein E3N88_13537 [Mikania micrantha]
MDCMFPKLKEVDDLRCLAAIADLGRGPTILNDAPVLPPTAEAHRPPKNAEDRRAPTAVFVRLEVNFVSN